MNSNPAAAMNARSSAAGLKSPGAAEKPSMGASSFPPTSPPVAPMPTEASMPRPSLNFKYAKLAQPMTAPAGSNIARRTLLGHCGRVRLVDQEGRIVRKQQAPADEAVG